MVSEHSALPAFRLENSKATAIIGGGGKSSLMAVLGEEYRRRGETAVMTTTTHIRPPEQNGYMGEDAAVLSDLLVTHRLMTVGTMSEERKFGPSPLLEQLPRLADHVIIEADGTKGLPLKVPNDQEPVIPAFADTVVAVAGSYGDAGADVSAFDFAAGAAERCGRTALSDPVEPDGSGR